MTIRKLIENALRSENYEVLLAATGEEGLQVARERRPDLILLDYVLPDLRGVEFCQRLLAEEATRQIPVLLISGHGSAIQELSRDCANVVDYLKKPFASNVLQAVITKAFEKVATRAAAPVAPAPAPAPTSKPANAPTAPVAVKPTDELRRRVFEKLVARLHGPLPSIPAWEAARGESEPLSYYLSRVLPLDLVHELADELARAAALNAAAPAPAEYQLCGTTRFASERHVLIHLRGENATGELRMNLPEESVSVFFENGTIVAISSNHPRFYCAGSVYPFLQVPHAVVSAAMLAQRDAAVPFFVTAAARGAHPTGVDLPALLRESGHRCMGRVYAQGESTFTFRALAEAELPPYVREHRTEFSLPQLLLESYRTVNDWQHVQQAVPRLELYVGRTAFDEAYFASLQLDPLERDLLERMDFRHSVAQLHEIVDRPLFEVCRAIFCLARLDLCYLCDSPLAEEPPAATTPATEAVPETAVAA